MQVSSAAAGKAAHLIMGSTAGLKLAYQCSSLLQSLMTNMFNALMNDV